MTGPQLRYLAPPLQGGPLHGKVLPLTSPGTLEITLRGMTGYYDKGSRWVETAPRCAYRNTARGYVL